MIQTTKLITTLKFIPSEYIPDIGEVVCILPSYTAEAFENVGGDIWRRDFMVSCSEVPEFAEGDFIDDFAPYFRPCGIERGRLIGCVQH